MKKEKTPDETLKNYECDGQYVFTDIEMHIEEEKKRA